jgi:hypothetical protein
LLVKSGTQELTQEDEEKKLNNIKTWSLKGPAKAAPGGLIPVLSLTLMSCKNKEKVK